jgi:hypothetical protein
MKLHHPFEISPRLNPAVRIQDAHSCAWLSYNGDFILDLPDGSEHVVSDFRAGCGSSLQSQFAAVLSFLSACAESRSYAERQGKDPMAGEHSDLFPPQVGAWAQQMSDEISLLSLEIEESESEPIEA